MGSELACVHEDVPIAHSLAIYLQIANYPILAQDDSRTQMREELFRRGVITPEALEEEVREKAILSQRREGSGPAVEKTSRSGSSACRRFAIT